MDQPLHGECEDALLDCAAVVFSSVVGADRPPCGPKPKRLLLGSASMSCSSQSSIWPLAASVQSLRVCAGAALPLAMLLPGMFAEV